MDAIGKRVGFLVVGVGFIGAQRAAAARVARGCRLVAVVDRDVERARAVAARLGVVAAPDFRAGLALGGVDAVVIATPHADHVEQVRRALDADKSVLCEKPLAIGAEEARELARHADERRLRLATGFNHRFYPPIRDALQLVETGAIGRVKSVRATIGHQASAEFLAGWHAQVERSGGGTLMDNGPHACDLVRRFLGEIVAAKGYVRPDPTMPENCELEAFALFRDGDHGFAEVRSSWALAEGYLTLEVRGSQGCFHVETSPWRLSGRLADGHRVERRYPLERLAEHLGRWRHGCERSLVRELEMFVTPGPHPRPGATGWDGCRATEMIQAVYRASATGREVPLVPLPVNLLTSPRRRAVVEVG